MTLEAELPLGPPIDMNTPATVELDEEDVDWYEEEFRKLEDPLYAFNLRCVHCIDSFKPVNNAPSFKTVRIH